MEKKISQTQSAWTHYKLRKSTLFKSLSAPLSNFNSACVEANIKQKFILPFWSPASLLLHQP